MGLRAWIYDRSFMPLTIAWYREVLTRLQPGARLLDVGIGTGGALAANRKLVVDRDLRVTGVDINPAYTARARERMCEAGLTDRVDVQLRSIYDYEVCGWDAVYFSASFMLMPDPEKALHQAMGLLAPGGRVFFTQTFHERRAPVMEVLKPMLKTFTTVDFGEITYEEEFMALLDAAGLEVEEHEELGKLRTMSYRLLAGHPVESGSTSSEESAPGRKVSGA